MKVNKEKIALMIFINFHLHVESIVLINTPWLCQKK